MIKNIFITNTSLIRIQTYSTQIPVTATIHENKEKHWNWGRWWPFLTTRHPILLQASKEFVIDICTYCVAKCYNCKPISLLSLVLFTSNKRWCKSQRHKLTVWSSPYSTRQKSEDCNMKHRAKVVSSQGSTVEMNKHQ